MATQGLLVEVCANLRSGVTGRQQRMAGCFELQALGGAREGERQAAGVLFALQLQCDW